MKKEAYNLIQFMKLPHLDKDNGNPSGHIGHKIFMLMEQLAILANNNIDLAQEIMSELAILFKRLNQ